MHLKHLLTSERSVFYTVITGIVAIALILLIDALTKSQNLNTADYLYNLIFYPCLYFMSSLLLALIYPFKNKNSFLNTFLSFLCLPTIYLLSFITVLALLFIPFLGKATAILVIFICFILPILIIPISLVLGFIVANYNAYKAHQIKTNN